MKKFFFIIVMMAFALPGVAESDNKPSYTPIPMESYPINPNPNPKPHRVPMRICVEAWYDAAAGTLSIVYYGETEGEVALYRDGELIDSSSVINTTFMIPGSGFYSIEITTDSWISTGSVEI